MLPARLTYLFTARFTDGTVYNQTPLDTSRDQPLTRSAFWDVQEAIRLGKKLKSFSVTNGTHTVEVFYDTGRFRIDGEDVFQPAWRNLTNFRVVYFRRVQQKITMTGKGRGRQKRMVSKQERPEVVAHVIGWQANDWKGNNYEEVFTIDPNVDTMAPLRAPIVMLRG